MLIIIIIIIINLCHGINCKSSLEKEKFQLMSLQKMQRAHRVYKFVKVLNLWIEGVESTAWVFNGCLEKNAPGNFVKVKESVV